MKLRAVSHSSEDTFRIGLELGRHLKPGLLILLNADIGGGKTTFVKGVMNDRLGDVVSSPSFTLINEYQKDEITVRHMDLYRLDDVEVIQRTINEYQDQEDGVIFLEWASVAQNLDQWDISVDVTLMPNPDERDIVLYSNTSEGRSLLEAMNI